VTASRMTRQPQAALSLGGQRSMPMAQAGDHVFKRARPATAGIPNAAVFQRPDIDTKGPDSCAEGADMADIVFRQPATAMDHKQRRCGLIVNPAFDELKRVIAVVQLLIGLFVLQLEQIGIGSWRAHRGILACKRWWITLAVKLSVGGHHRQHDLIGSEKPRFERRIVACPDGFARGHPFRLIGERV